MSAELVIPNEVEIRHARPIPRKEIEEVLKWHRELCEPTRMIFNRAVRIGFKLRCWHDLIPHGRWTEWCTTNLPEIHERTIRRYVQLWDNHEWLEGGLSNRTPVSDLEQLPTIKEALALLVNKRAADCPAPAKEKRPNRPRDIVTIVTRVTKPDSPSESVRPVKIEDPDDDPDSGDFLEATEITRCPTCGRPL